MNAFGRDPESALTAHADAIRRLARAIVGDPHLAEEVAQESLIVALRRPAPVGRAPWPWFAGIVRNVARNARRAERRRQARERRASESASAPVAATPLDHLARLDAQRDVVDAVANLAEPHRQTIVLHYFEGLTIDAIAARLAIPRETVRTRVRTGLARLRQTLGGAPGRHRMRTLAVLAGSASTVGTLGVLAMKKAVVVAAVVVLCLAAGTWWFLSRTPSTPPTPVEPSELLSGLERSPHLKGQGSEAPDDEGESAAGTKRVRLAGRVVDAMTGEPVSGARVRALSADISEVAADDAARLASATSDVAGRFEMHCDELLAAYVLIADTPRHSPRWVWVRPNDDVTIALDPPRTITGHVRDRHDKPVSGATVRWLGVLGAMRYEREAHTNAEGLYRLVAPRLRQIDMTGALDVSAKGFAPVRVPLSRVPATSGEDRYDILLLHGATLHGTVVDASTRRPIAGAQLFFWGESFVTGIPRFDGGMTHNPFYARHLGVARSDDAGRFQFDHVPAWNGQPQGVHTADRWNRRLGYLGASADGYVVQSTEVTVPDDGKQVHVEFALERAGTVVGRVVDSGGQPVAGVAVSWSWSDGSHPAWIDSSFDDAPRQGATTDVAGVYRLQGVGASADERKTVALQAHGPGSAWWRPQARVQVAVVADRETEAPDLVLPPAPHFPFVDVVVVSKQAVPIAGAYPVGGLNGSRSDADGTLRVYFRAEVVGETTVAVHALGYAPETIVVTPSKDPASATRVVLARSGSASAPGFTPGPAPAPAVLSGSLRGAQSGEPILKYRGELHDASGDAAHWASFAGPGRFSFHDVPDGPWTLRIVAPGYDGLTKEVRVSSDDPQTLDLRLIERVTSRVCCKDEAGKPLRNARVNFQGPGGYLTADLDTTGCAVVRGLKPGKAYAATCSRAPPQGMAQWFVPVPYEPTSIPESGLLDALELTFQRAGVATLRIHGKRLGHPAQLTPEQSERRAQTRAWLIDASGRRIWKRVHLRGGGWSVIAPQGRFTLRLEVPGGEPIERALELDADPSTVVVVEVPE